MLTLLTNVTIARAVGNGKDRLWVKVSREVYDRIILSDSLAWPSKFARCPRPFTYIKEGGTS